MKNNRLGVRDWIAVLGMLASVVAFWARIEHRLTTLEVKVDNLSAARVAAR